MKVIDEASAATAAVGASFCAHADAWILRLDPALDAIIPVEARLEKVAEGFQFLEGPLWVRGELWFSDLAGNQLYALDPDGRVRVLLDRSGGDLGEPPPGAFPGSNGLAMHADGVVLMAQHGARRIVRVTRDLDLDVHIDRFEGRRLNSPNDLVYAPDGALWFTDPPYGLAGQDEDRAKEISFSGVYRYADGRLTAAITDLPRPNGIGFSPDGRTLYVSNSEPEMFLNAYEIGRNGEVLGVRLFITFPGPNPPDLPDGLKVDSRGNVWACGPGGIRIINPEGKVLGQLKSGDRAQANLAWGGEDLKTAYITASGTLYRLTLAVPGQPPLYRD